MLNESKQPSGEMLRTLMHALRRTFLPLLFGWVPFNQMGACVPQLLGNTLFSGIFPPTKLVKRYHPLLNLRSHRATCPAFKVLFMLRRGSLISVYVEFEQQEPSLQSSGVWDAIVLGATSTKKLIKAKSAKPIFEDNVQYTCSLLNDFRSCLRKKYKSIGLWLVAVCVSCLNVDEEVNGVFVVYAEGIVIFWHCYSEIIDK